MKREFLVAFFCGLIFAIGLALSGMTQPGKVIAFLDFFGAWDASLVFVMGGAILVYSIGYRLVTKRKGPLFATEFQIPKLRKVDRPVVLGSILFGIGWGIAGFCPGPGVVSLATLRVDALIFVLFLLAGMFTFKTISARASA